MASSNILVKVLGDSSSLRREFGAAARATDSFAGRHPHLARAMKLTGTAALGLAGAVGGGMVLAFKQGFESLKEHEAVEKQVEQAIKTTGKAAGVTVDHIKRYADQIENVSGVDDVMIEKSAAAVLAFTNIRNEVGKGNDVFDRTIQLATDISVRLGKDLPSTAQQLAKALNSPADAFGKLARMGIQFSDAQKTAIETMVEAGDTMGAQKLILEELEKKFGGAAKAAGETFEGKLKKLKNTFEEFGEKLATKVMPYAKRFIDFLTDIMDSDSAGEVMKKLGDGLEKIGDTIGNWLSKVDWAKLARQVGEKLGQALAAVDWPQVMSVIGEGLFQMFGGISTMFEPAYRAIDMFFADVAEKLAGVNGLIADFLKQAGLETAFPGFQTAADSLNEYADALRSKWERFDNLRKLHEQDLALTERLTSKFGTTAQEVNQKLRVALAGGLKTLAGAFVDLRIKIKPSDLAIQTFATRMGRLPNKKELKLLLQDKEARSALEEYTRKLNGLPLTKKAKLELLADYASQLAEKFKTKIDALPKKASTKVDAPGAKESADKLQKMREHADKIPSSKNTKTTTSNTSTAINQLNQVQRAAEAIPNTVTVNVNVGQNHPLPRGAGGFRNFRGGYAIVGEEGPELVRLPAGSDVYSAPDTARMVTQPRPLGAASAGLTVIVNVAGSVLSGRDLAELVRAELLKVGRRNLSTGLT